jgi:uncharacterized membrane-anchored protein YhcB (DUF1043 family)
MVLAHRLAAVVINYQTVSGDLAPHLANLARSPLPPAPPPFEQVCAIVEQVVGVRFRELFVRLPQRAPSGDAAIAAVWELVKAEGERQKAEILAQFEPLLQAIAAVARGDQSKRHIAEAARRIWAGEREPETLTARLDEQDAALVRRVLELLG